MIEFGIVRGFPLLLAYSLFLLDLESLDLFVHFSNLLGGFLDLVLLVFRVKGLLEVEKLGALEFEILHTIFKIQLLLIAQIAMGFFRGFKLLDSAVCLAAVFQLGIFVELCVIFLYGLVEIVCKSNICVVQLIVVEDKTAIVNKSVAVKHTGEGLGKYRLTGTGFAHDGY